MIYINAFTKKKEKKKSTLNEKCLYPVTVKKSTSVITHPHFIHIFKVSINSMKFIHSQHCGRSYFTHPVFAILLEIQIRYKRFVNVVSGFELVLLMHL